MNMAELFLADYDQQKECSTTEALGYSEHERWHKKKCLCSLFYKFDVSAQPALKLFSIQRVYTEDMNSAFSPKSIRFIPPDYKHIFKKRIQLQN